MHGYKVRYEQKSRRQIPSKDPTWAILQTKVKIMVELSMKRAMKQQSILIYLYSDSMAIEGTRPECCSYIIKVAPCFREEIHHACVSSKYHCILLFCICCPDAKFFDQKELKVKDEFCLVSRSTCRSD